ncbi:MAG: hypothetical protein JXQ90_20210, partial [Cyclobacteriaceae bacterium]
MTTNYTTSIPEYISGSFRIMLVMILIAGSFTSLAQTKGMIIEPASGTVLDPDGDGYISNDASGFSGDSDDTDEFESSGWTPFPTVGAGEVLSDVRSGPNEGFTDFSVDPGGFATYLRNDGTNLIFRFRMADYRPNAKGYTVLIDTDGQIGADEVLAGDNPGFELAVVLRSKHEVSILDIDGQSGCPTADNTYTLADNSQKAVSGIESGGNLDFFYDFYVPLADLYTAGGINASTGLRFAATTNTSNSCTFQGSLSDIGGMDDNANGCLACALTEIVEVQTPTSITDITSSGFPTACPSLPSEIQAGTSVAVSGTAALGSTVRIYIDGALDQTITADASTGVYSATLSSVTAGDVITATAQISGYTVSNSTCNTVTATESCAGAPAAMSFTPANGASGSITGSTATGFGTLADIQMEFRPYGDASLLAGDITAYDNATGAWTFELSGGAKTSGVSYEGRIRAVGGCWSDWAIFCGYGNNATQGDIPVITSSNPISAGSGITISGTVDAPNKNNLDGVKIIAVQGGSTIGSVTIAATKNTTGNAWSITGVTVDECGDVELRSQVRISGAFDGCFSDAALLSVNTVQSSTPTVTGSYCSPVETIYGTSSEDVGTAIDVLVNGSSIGVTTVDEFGTWTLTGLNVSTGTITATAENSNACESKSASSAGVTISTSPSAPTISGWSNVSEGTTSITVSPSGSYTLYIDGSEVTDAAGTPITTTNGVFTGLSANNEPESYIYAGGQLSVTTTSGGCESPISGTEEVPCTVPSTSLTVTPNSASISSGSTVDVTVESAVSSTIYELYNTNLAANTGVTGLGVGSNLTLTSSALTANTTLQVKAFKIFPASCTSTLTDNVPVTIVVGSPPTTNDVTNASSILASAGATDIDNPTGTDSDGTITAYRIKSLPATGTLYKSDGSTAVLDEESLTVAVANGLKFDPAGSNIGNVTFTLAAIDNDGNEDSSPATFTIPIDATVSITASDATADETGSNDGEFTVSLSVTNNTGSAITIPLTLSSGTATNGTDYTTITQAVIPDGQSSVTVAVDVTDDALFENNETVIAEIGDLSGTYFAQAGASNQSATVTISDDDPVTVQITATDATANESGPDHGEYTVSLSSTNNTGAAIVIPLTMSGTATNGTDYSSITQASVPDGQSSVTVALTVTADALFENNETATAAIGDLSGVTGVSAGAGNQSADVTIGDDDGVTVSITATDATANESGPDHGEYTVSLSSTNNTGAAIVIPLTMSGTATNGTDYSSITQASIPNGQSSITVALTVVNDSDVEGGETATAAIGNLSGVTGVSAGASNQSADVAIADDDAGNVAPTTNDLTNAGTITYGDVATDIDNPTGSDSDGTVDNYRIKSLPASGTLYHADGTTPVTDEEVLTVSEANGLKYVPGNAGSDSFTLAAIDNDGAEDSSPATYTINVTAKALT